MKAHPDFKWYKLPTPPARTLVTRPSNCRSNQNQNGKNGQKSNCGITLGKLVDDKQLGGLSSLINTPVSSSSSSTTCSNSLLNSSMAQKTAKNILKPPKKRYLVNGEFKCHSEVSSGESRDYPSRSACSALLEFAEICTSNAVRESASVLNTDGKDNDSSNFIPPITASSKYTPISTESSDHSLPGSFTYPVLCSMQKSEEGKHNLFSSGGTNVSSQHRTDATSHQQEQPLDLCKNKEKTITASHQQLIDHFVDKFLCDTPVPLNSCYKSSIIDPTFCKILSDKCSSDSSVSKGENINHASFTLSVAIESAVDKAYGKSSSKSHKVEVPDNSAIVEHITQSSCDFNFQFKIDDIKMPAKHTVSDAENTDKQSDKNADSTSSVSYDNKSVKNIADSTSADATYSNSKSNKMQSSKLENNRSSPFFCKRLSPPKKSRVWCDIFMNEQMSKNDNVERKSHLSNNIVSDLPSPARRSSQRTCKGRRYQALITEGLLQSSKERKNNSSRKSGSAMDKSKNKGNPVTENNLVPVSKKKRKREDKNKPVKNESQEFGKSLFNLEEKIASLPKCNFEQMSRKKNLETVHCSKQESVNPSTSTSSENFCTSSSEINEWHPVTSSGRYKTGSFDLEQYIVTLPKCNIEVLSKRKKKD